MAIGLGAKVHELVETQDSNEEDKKEGVDAIRRILEAMTKVGQTT